MSYSNIFFRFVLCLLLAFPAAAHAITDCDADFVDDLSQLRAGAVEDCDRDGVPDVCTLQPRGISFAEHQVLRALPAGDTSTRYAFADLNNDHLPDLIESDSGEPIRIYYALDRGSFGDPVEITSDRPFSNATGVSAIRGAHGTDLIATSNSHNVLVLTNNGTGNFALSEIPNSTGESIRAVGDINGDALDDLLGYHGTYSGENLVETSFIRINAGSGNFSARIPFPQQYIADSSPAVGSLNEDAREDLVVALDGKLVLLFSRGDGTFDAAAQLQTPGLSLSSAIVADFNNNALPDILFSYSGTPPHVPAASRSGVMGLMDFAGAAASFTPVAVSFTPCSKPHAVDFNEDGFSDLVCEIERHYSHRYNSIFDSWEYEARRLLLNDTTARFRLAASGLGYSYHWSTWAPWGYGGVREVTYADVSGDGKPEALAVWISGSSFSGESQIRSYPLIFNTQPPLEDDADFNAVPDSCQSGSLYRHRYTVWNTFAELINILELVNAESSATQVQVIVRDSLGSPLAERSLVLAADQEFDLIVSDIPDVSDNAYGVIEIVSSGLINGGISFYKQTALASKASAGFDTGEFDFAFQLPLAAPHYGAATFLFNTCQPSMRRAEASLPVVQWLSIINLARSTSSFVVRSTNSMSGESREHTVELGPYARIDLDAGHGLFGANSLGYHTVTPIDAAAPYLAFLTRYGTTADPGRFSYAFAATPRTETSEPVLPISTGGNAENWLEIVNTNSQINVWVRIYALKVDGTGFDTDSSLSPFNLQPNESRHVNAGAIIGPNNTGSASVYGDKVGLIMAQSVFYFHEPRTGAIETAYASPAASVQARRSFTATYNLFWGMANWLRIINHDTPLDSLPLSIFSADAPEPHIYIDAGLPRNGTRELDLHNHQRFNTRADTYGTVRLEVDRPTTFSGDMLRVKPTASGRLDFIMRTGLQ